MRSRARIENFPITISGSYQVVVETYCGDELCGTCGLSLQVDCREQVPVGDGTSGLHSIILNPANDPLSSLSMDRPGSTNYKP